MEQLSSRAQLRMFALMLIFIFVLGCSKDEVNTDININLELNTHIKAGRYEGQIYYCLPGVVEHTIPAYRTVKFINDSIFEMRWWSTPDTSVLVTDADTIHYTMTYDVRSTSCGNQRTVFDFIVQDGYMSNDVLNERGMVVYKHYYNGEIDKTSTGLMISLAKLIN